VLVRSFRPRMVCTVCGIVGAGRPAELVGDEGKWRAEPTVLLNVLSQVAQLCGTRITAEQGGEDCGSFRRAQSERAISVERCSYRARDNRSCEECLQRGLCLDRQGEKCSDHFQQTRFLGPATAFEQSRAITRLSNQALQHAYEIGPEFFVALDVFAAAHFPPREMLPKLRPLQLRCQSR
jgi:hypothetical protein